MKIALLSDIHSNIQALQTCLTHARKLGVDQFAILGDTVGYGGNPAEVLDTVMELHQQGAWVVQGNHDSMAVNPPKVLDNLGSILVDWTHSQLRPEQLNFLAQLPLTKNHKQALFVHASAHKPGQWPYINDTQKAQQCIEAAEQQFQCKHVFVGHLHVQTLYYQNTAQEMMAFSPKPNITIPTPLRRSMVVSVGSVGQPRDGNPMSMYALYDTRAETLCFFRLNYDHESARKAIPNNASRPAVPQTSAP
jgi:diadenosine tetraphosphatase ApaH/serine/threonine PP2A family protein phosphatase